MSEQPSTSHDCGQSAEGLAGLGKLTKFSGLAPALWPRRLLMAPVRAYRFWLSPWLGSACRFEPTCSVYALQALERHGAWRGLGLSGWRILRCHPWCQGGHDPVPAPPVTPATKSPNDTQGRGAAAAQALPEARTR